MVYFDKILHTYACQHFLTTGMHSSLFYGHGFAKHQSGGLWSVSKMLITLEPHGIIRSCKLFYFNIVQTQECKMVTRLRGASFWTIEVLVKIPTTLEPHGILCSNFAYLYILTLSRQWYKILYASVCRLILRNT